MTLDEFANITFSIISKHGFADFQPTACFPERRDVRVLAGLPASKDVETESIAWARKSAIAEEEFLVAFKVAPEKFKIFRFSGDRTESSIFNLE